MKTISEYRISPLEEEAEIVPYNELHVVVLGTGDGDGTFADIVEEVSVKRDIKYNFVDVTKSWIAASDIDIGTVKLRNIDGKDTNVDIYQRITQLSLLEQVQSQPLLHKRLYLLYKILVSCLLTIWIQC